MDLLKALKRTTFLSAMALLAYGATEAGAADGTAVGAHVNCSVTAALTITELQQIKFGNVATVGVAAPDDGTVHLNLDGTRTSTTGKILLLYGNGNGGVTGGNHDSGSQTPGIYHIVTGSEATNVYITFADANGDIMDTEHGENASDTVTSTNFVDMTNATDHFAVDHFIWEGDSGATPPGYGVGTPAPNASNPTYGTYVVCGASCNIRVAASMHTHSITSAVYSPGLYTGNFEIMVSY